MKKTKKKVSPTEAKLRQPTQPLFKERNIVKFKPNPIVVYLLENSRVDLTTISRMEFKDEDRTQLVQLLGASIGEFSDLPFVDKDVLQEVKAQVDGWDEV